MFSKNITLEDGLEIEVEFQIQPEEEEAWGYNGGHPHISAQLEDLAVVGINEGDIPELCEYINNKNGDFFEELEIKIMKEKEEFDEK